MKNHGLGTHNDKICADMATTQLPKLVSYLGCVEKSPHHMSTVHVLKYSIHFWLVGFGQKT